MALVSGAAPVPARGARKRRQGGGGLRVSGALALWRLRNTWRLTLLVELGMLTAVALVCAVPLFARVAAVAGLEHAINRYPNARVFTASFYTNQPTAAHIQEAQTRFRPVIDRYFGPFGVGEPAEFSMLSPELPIETPTTASPGGSLTLWATTTTQQNTQLRLVAGQLPASTSVAPLEIAVSPATLSALGLKLNDTIVVGAPGTSKAILPLRVVGLVERVSPAVYPDPDLNPPADKAASGASRTYWVVASSDAVSTAPISWAALIPPGQRQTPPNQTANFWWLNWIYPANLAHLDQINTDDLGQYQRDRYLAITSFSAIPWMSQTFLWSDAPDVLYAYGQRIMLAQIASTLLLLGALGLVLLFLTQINQMLVESQAQSISGLRSRGASRGQVFWAFALQSLYLGGIALAAGPLLAHALARLVALWMLPQESGHALAALSGGPLALYGRVWLYALVTILVAIATLLLAGRRVSRLSVLGLRSETARGGNQPLWQRLYLDVMAALLALAGYGLFALTSQLARADSSQSAINLRLALAPLALVAPIFLMVAATLLFLRAVPYALRLAGRLAARGRGPTAMLALTQLARATRPALRIVVLLALTTCFAVFTLITQATASQRVTDLAAFQSGADISGGLLTPSAPGAAGLASGAAAYNALPGVIASSLAYRTAAPIARETTGPYQFGDGNSPVIQIAAVDTSTFASAALWSPDDSTRPLDQLTASLRAQRAQAIAQDAVPVIADDGAWRILGLHSGSIFTLPVAEYPTGTMRFLAVERVERIPTMFNDLGLGSGAGAGGMLVDYQSFAAVYAHDTGDTTGKTIAANFVWLRTVDDPATLARLRSALNSGPLRLGDLQSNSAPSIGLADRRVMQADFSSDPIYLSLVGILGIGAAAALALALVGAILGARLWTREQLPALAVLRALGIAPREARGVLRWQHGLVYISALILGSLLGETLAVVAAPSLVDLTFASTASSYSGPSLDNSLPVRFVFATPQVALALAAISALCALALVFSARVSARAQLGESLRLNADEA